MVVAAATALEAAPLEQALARRRTYEAATKTVVVGELTSNRYSSGFGKPLPVALVVTGCDKTNVGHALTLVLERMESLPSLVMQIGIGGGFLTAGAVSHPAVGDVVLATSESYTDTGSSSPGGWLSARELGLPVCGVEGVEFGGFFPLDRQLVAEAAGVLEQACREEKEGLAKERPAAGAVEVPPRIWLGPCVTSSQVTGTRREAEEIAHRFGALAESMEGAAAAHVCALYGLPFLEIRGLSNLVGDRDRTSWQVERAARAAAWAGLRVLCRLEDLPLGAER